MPRRWTIEEENERREELVEFYVNRNKTIAEIGKILMISEKTVFKRMKRLNIPSTPERKFHYLNKKRGELIFPNLSEKLAEFFGIMLGDGHLSHGQIWVFINNNIDRKYRNYVKNLLKFLFGVEAGCNYRKKEDMKNLFLSSVDLVRYLKEKGLYATNKVKAQVDIPSWVFTKDSYKRSFLRGFFDTDGSIYRLRFGVQMAFCNRSIPLLQSTRKILLELGYFPSKISSYNVYLTRKSNLYRYVAEIGFGNPKHFKRAKEFGIIFEGA